jgi:hypothetical protein
MKNNAELQSQINKIRIKKSIIDESIRNSFDNSINRGKNSKLCLCY